ncbi:MAG TPA: YkgJ family cysteine cluster protein [Tepidisphaeraceae bacterium]|jgi:Fe-S-cluster containining protein|nr:YkgJ family cysteine cluster protein [Tepidisphaeraceae bacterium]
MAALPQSSPVRTATVELTINGRRIGLRVAVPDRALRPAELLPVYRSISEQLMAVAVQDVERAGFKVSCKAGCGACCRQLVPISPIEARELVKVIDRMPEPRRTEVRRRFSAVRHALQEAGLLERLTDPRHAREGSALSEEYWRLRLPCPFLENESCSIYPDRPIACREYLVVSPAAHCAEPTSENVRAIPLPAGPVPVRVPHHERNADGTPADWVALTLSPDYVAANPTEPPPRPATELVGEFFAGAPGAS